MARPGTTGLQGGPLIGAARVYPGDPWVQRHFAGRVRLSLYA